MDTNTLVHLSLLCLAVLMSLLGCKVTGSITPPTLLLHHKIFVKVHVGR